MCHRLKQECQATAGIWMVGKQNNMDDKLSYDDERRRHTKTLSELLAKTSSKHIKQLGEKLRGCVPKS